MVALSKQLPESRALASSLYPAALTPFRRLWQPIVGSVDARRHILTSIAQADEGYACVDNLWTLGHQLLENIYGIVSDHNPLKGHRFQAQHIIDCLKSEFYFPIQNVEKIKFRMSSLVVSPVSESR